MFNFPTLSVQRTLGAARARLSPTPSTAIRENAKMQCEIHVGLMVLMQRILRAPLTRLDLIKQTRGL